VSNRRSASVPSAGSLGGAANWAGNDHERAVAAFLAAHLLAQRPVKSFDMPPWASVPLTLRLQADEPVDDIVCGLSGGGSAYLQVKTRLDHGRVSNRSFSSVAGQWKRLAAERTLKPSKDRLMAVAETTSDAIRTLRDVLERSRRPMSETDTAKQATEKQRFEKALSSLSLVGTPWPVVPASGLLSSRATTRRSVPWRRATCVSWSPRGRLATRGLACRK